MGATDEDRALLTRLLAGDPTASAAVVERHLTPLIRSLERSFPRVSEDLIWDAATDAILTFAEAPVTYDPDVRALAGYLMMAARGDLLNALARLRYLQRHENVEDPVELDGPGGNTGEAPPEAEQALIDQDLWQKLTTTIADPIERGVLDLMMEGERDTEAFVEVMGIGHLDLDEQRVEVKRMKDKLKARLRRVGRDEFL